MMKGVLIDLDNTIVDYSTAHDIALNCVIEKYFKSDNKSVLIEYEISKNIVHKRIPNTHSRLLYFQNLCERLSLTTIDILEIENQYWDIFYSNLTLKEGIVDLLQFFVNNDIKICLVSDFESRFQFEKLKRLNVLKYFSYIVTSEEAGVEKPHEYIFQYALNKLKLDKNQVIMIGDNFKKDVVDDIFCCYYNEKMNGIKWYQNYLEYNNHSSLLYLFQELFKAIKELSSIGKYYGLKEEFVQAGGGNISIKLKEYNLTIIKASGYNLSDIELHQGICVFYSGGQLTRVFLKQDKPSIETLFHLKLPAKYIIHLHPNFILNDLVEENDESVTLPYLTPGKDIMDYIEEHKYTDKKIIYLKNHGVIFQKDTIDDIYLIEEYLNKFNYKASAFFLKNTASLIIKRINKTYPPTPDIAVYCGHDKVFVNEYNEQLFINYNYSAIKNIKEYYQIKSVFEQYIKMLDDIDTDQIDELNITKLSDEEINKLILMPAEIHRKNMK